MRLPRRHDLAETPARERPALRVVEAAPAPTPETRTATGLPIAVWPCAQQTSQVQRHGRYLPESNRHPAKMLPELARRAISAYSEPGELVLDPMCGIGTTLVEAIHLGRSALGVELEPRWASLALANIAHARDQHASGAAAVLEGDARELPHLLARKAQRFLTRLAGSGTVAAHPAGAIALVLTSPPYGCEIGELDKRAWGTGHDLCLQQTRNYSGDRANLGHARDQRYLDAMADVYRASAAVLRPGGFLVVVTKDLRAQGALSDLAGQTIQLCRDAGLLYWQRVIALLATVGERELVPRPSFWQVLQLRKAIDRGERTQLVCHEDVLVFRKPQTNAATSAADERTAGRGNSATDRYGADIPKRYAAGAPRGSNRGRKRNS
jgi:DNA modification methylase